MAKSDLNTVTLVGRLVADPKQEFTSGGMAITKFAIANNYYSKTDDDAVNFFDFVAFGKTAEICANYLRKGKQVAISGELRQNRWKSQEGQTRSRVEIIVRDMQMLGGKDDYQPGGSSSAHSSPAPQKEERNVASKPEKMPAEPEITEDGVFDDDDVPF